MTEENIIATDMNWAFAKIDEIVADGIKEIGVQDYCDNFKPADNSDEQRKEYAQVKKLGAMIRGGIIKIKSRKEFLKKIPLKEVVLPKEGKLVSEFCIEISEILKKKNCLFFRPDARDIVEIGKIKRQKTGEEVYTGFIKMKPNRFITLIEDHIIPGNKVYNEQHDSWSFKKKSMGKEISDTSLHSDIMQKSLPQINRIFTIPIPIMHDGVLTFPKKGYDERFDSWLDINSPDIVEIKLKEAKELIDVIFEEFCFENTQDKINAIAGLLTPFLRGLYNEMNDRSPLFFYISNRIIRKIP